MAYVKARIPTEVYHVTKRENVESIRTDKRIRRFGDTECWFCRTPNDMLRYMEYLRGFSSAMALKAVGKDEEAHVAAKEFFNQFGKYEVEMERYYDHAMMYMGLNAIFSSKPGLAQ